MQNKKDMIYDEFTKKHKKLVLLIDPDKHSETSLCSIAALAEKEHVHCIFVGGSLVSKSVSETVLKIKQQYHGPVVLFPGSAAQVSSSVDAILFLSLISGRNAEFLIGNHVLAAPQIKAANIETIPVGYILIDCGAATSVEYMSNTRPIPYNKPDIAVATAIAGELLGLKMIYLEGGSGASTIVNPELISAVRASCSLPLIVGGGIRSVESLSVVYSSGADIAVVGTAIERDSSLLSQMMKVVTKFNENE